MAGTGGIGVECWNDVGGLTGMGMRHCDWDFGRITLPTDCGGRRKKATTYTEYKDLPFCNTKQDRRRKDGREQEGKR